MNTYILYLLNLFWYIHEYLCDTLTFTLKHVNISFIHEEKPGVKIQTQYLFIS
jgi:hypothetical protein